MMSRQGRLILVNNDFGNSEPTSFASLSSGKRPEMLMADRVGGLDSDSMIANYWRIARRHKWLLLTTIAATLIFSLILTVISEKQYTAVTKIEIARANGNVVDVENIRNEVTTADQEFYATQYGLLQSNALAERVAKTLKLSRDPRFIEAFNIDSETAGAALNDKEALLTIRKILLTHLVLEPIRSSSLVNVGFISTQPGLSADIANTWARAFIQSNIDRGFEETAFAREYLEEKLVELRDKLETSERQAVGYARRERIFQIDQTNEKGSVVSSRSLTEQELSAFNDALNDATTNRIAAEAAFRNNATTNPSSNGSLEILRGQRAQAAAEYQQMLVQFEPGYPVVKALASRLSQLDKSIVAEEKRFASSARQDLNAQFQSARSREISLRAKVSETTQKLLDEKNRRIDYNIYEREVDNNRQLYDALLQRYKEVGVSSGVGSTNVSIVDRADVPQQPSSPNLILNLLIALFVGTVLGLILTILREQFDVSFNDSGDVERQLGLSLLGTIPDSGTEDLDTVAMIHDRKSALSEAYMSLRTRLAFATTHGFPKVISVTSTRPGEGKSTSSLALANALAVSGKRVLLIDCDMRSPSLHTMLGCNNERGLSNALAGDDDLSQIIVNSHAAKGIDLIPAGPQPPNAAELMIDDRMGLLLARLSESYDHVVCDSPPVIGLADALLIATKVEATLFVIRAHSTNVSSARSALQRLTGVPCNLVGALLTHFDPGQTTYGYGYDYGYGYSTGEVDTGRSTKG